MKTDWTHPNPVFIDFETQSVADLRKVGGRAYAYDPSTRIAMCAFLQDDRAELWIPNNPFEFPERIDNFRVVREMPQWVLDSPLCAHNAFEFDAHIWSAAKLPDVTWRDTLPLCRAASLPGSLDKACAILFGEGKKSSDVMMSLARAKLIAGSVQYTVGTIAAWIEAAKYCCHDVMLLRKLHTVVIRYAEPEVLDVHQKINDRGFPVDVAFAARLALLQNELAVKNCNQIAQLTEDDLRVSDVRSATKVKRWLESMGCSLPTRDGRSSLDRRDLKQLFENPEEFCGDEHAELVANVLKLRADAIKNTTSKCLRIIHAGLDTNRAVSQHVYHKAHTGRFAARDIQPHNFPRGIDDVDTSLVKDDLSLEEVEQEATRLNCSVADVLCSLLRPCIAPGPLSIADYGAIEARGTCWMTFDNAALSLFRDIKADPYVELAKRIYGVSEVTKQQRWNAKQVELGCGYGMSGKKLGAMFNAWNVDTGVSPEKMVKTYRSVHAPIVKAWFTLEKAALAAFEGLTVNTCHVQFSSDGSSLYIKLPSNRKMIFRNARVEMLVPAYCEMYDLPRVPKPTITYLRPEGWRSFLFGGRILENIVQGSMRDVLCDAMIRAENEGRNPCMHVHDELVCESDDSEGLAQMMAVAPEWGKGLPILVEAFTANRYFKKPPKGTIMHRSLK